MKLGTQLDESGAIKLLRFFFFFFHSFFSVLRSILSLVFLIASNLFGDINNSCTNVCIIGSRGGKTNFFPHCKSVICFVSLFSSFLFFLSRNNTISFKSRIYSTKFKHINVFSTVYNQFLSFPINCNIFYNYLLNHVEFILFYFITSEIRNGLLQINPSFLHDLQSIISFLLFL